MSRLARQFTLTNNRRLEPHIVSDYVHHICFLYVSSGSRLTINKIQDQYTVTNEDHVVANIVVADITAGKSVIQVGHTWTSWGKKLEPEIVGIWIAQDVSDICS